MKRAGLRARLKYSFESVRNSASLRAATTGLFLYLLSIIATGSLFLVIFEHGKNQTISTYPDALWCTWITITTVGYGTNAPVTSAGKITILITMIASVGMLTTYFSMRSTRKVMELKSKRRGLRMKSGSTDHYLVLGWNDRAPFVIEALVEILSPERTQLLLMCDRQENPCDNDYVFFLRGDPSNADDLTRANVGRAKAAILLADEAPEHDSSCRDVDASTVLAALAIHAAAPDLRITAEVLEPRNTIHLEHAGVTETLDSNAVLGALLARSSRQAGLIRFTTSVLAHNSMGRLKLIDINDEMVGLERERLIELLYNERGVFPVLILEGDTAGIFSGDRVLKPGDRLLVVPVNAEVT